MRSEISTSSSQRRRTFRTRRRVNFCLRFKKHVLKVKKKSKKHQNVLLNNFFLSRIWKNTTFLTSFKNTLVERRNFHFFSNLKHPRRKIFFDSYHIDKIMKNYWQISERNTNINASINFFYIKARRFNNITWFNYCALRMSAILIYSALWIREPSDPRYWT